MHENVCPVNKDILKGMIKIFQFMTVPPPYGGVTVYVKRLVKYLEINGFSVGCFYKDKIAKDALPKSVRMHRYPRYQNSIWAIVSIPRLLFILRKYDIIHTHKSLNISFTLWILRKLLRKPIVFTIHNQMISRECSCLSSIDRYFFCKLKNDHLVQFITVNNSAAGILQSEFGNFKNPIIVKPAFVQPIEEGSVSDYLNEDLITFLSKDSAPIILFYAESFAMYEEHEIYGTSTVIAYKRLKSLHPDLKLLFCMPNPDHIKIQILKSQLDLEEYKNDIYWQLTPLSEMWPVIKQSTVLFRPTYTDGDAVMIRESLLYGIPVVTTDVVNRPHGCHVYKYGSLEDAICILDTIISRPYKVTPTSNNYASDLVSIYSSLLT